jgi:hypothetical protein
MVFGPFFTAKGAKYAKEAEFFVFLTGWRIRFSLFELIFIEERMGDGGPWTGDGGQWTVDDTRFVAAAEG